MKKKIIQIFSGNFLSKLLGLLREIITAGLFGTGESIGAFRTAQTGTLTLINFFTSDTLSSAFIPQYREFQEKNSENAQRFFWSLFFIIFLFSLALFLSLWNLASTWITFLAPGFSATTLETSARMLQLISLSIPLYLVSTLLIFLSMANQDFVPMAIRPNIQNLGMIAGVLWAYLVSEPMFLVWGFVGAYGCFLLWIMHRCWQQGFLQFPQTWDWKLIQVSFSIFWKTLRPLLLLPIFLQGSIAIERAVASLVGLDAVSSLDYAKFISETLILLISVPIAFVGLSHWSGQSEETVRRSIEKTMYPLFLIAIPISFFLLSHSQSLVSLLYARGAFDSVSVTMTSDILFGISFGLWAQVAGYIFIKALNAQIKNHTAVKVMALALALSATFNLTMYSHLGAITLGISNSILGISMLVGSLIALRFWSVFLPIIFWMLLGATGFLLLNFQIDWPSHVLMELLLASLFATVYWLCWVALVPTLRRHALQFATLIWKKAI